MSQQPAGPAGNGHAAPGDPLERARALLPQIAAAAPQIERERRIPEPLLTAMLEAGLFRLLVPRSLNGGEVDPLTFLRVMELVAGADASAAWCLCQTGVCGLTAAFLAPEAAREIFGPQRAVLAWGFGFSGKAVAAPGGYRVTAGWGFASGGHHATWLGGQCYIQEADGSPRLNSSGAPVGRTMLFPAAAATLSDVWDVMGLRGTGSDSYAVNDLFVPEAHTVARNNQRERRESGPLYTLTTDNLFSSGFASVALGVARSMVEAFIQLAREKTPRGYRGPLGENAETQSDLAQAEAKLRAARFFLHGAVGDAWASVLRSGQALTLEQRIAIRLAATHAIHQAKQVASWAYEAAGSTAIFAANPFERRFRDIHSIAQQVQGRKSHFQTVGKFMLGQEIELNFL
ncbi:MAG TPA: acyl-CoA dehydrogenase family protein [bacterium]|nr:acyl-CoA dehydrogenase family protein [bacterium]